MPLGQVGETGRPLALLQDLVPRGAHVEFPWLEGVWHQLRTLRLQSPGEYLGCVKDENRATASTSRERTAQTLPLGPGFFALQGLPNPGPSKVSPILWTSRFKLLLQHG